MTGFCANASFSNETNQDHTKFICVPFHVCSGYQPPEHIHRNLVSKKFDIFSLGVIMINIIEARHSDYYTSDDSDNFVDTVRNDGFLFTRNNICFAFPNAPSM